MRWRRFARAAGPPLGTGVLAGAVLAYLGTPEPPAYLGLNRFDAVGWQKLGWAVFWSVAFFTVLWALPRERMLGGLAPHLAVLVWFGACAATPVMRIDCEPNAAPGRVPPFPPGVEVVHVKTRTDQDVYGNYLFRTWTLRHPGRSAADLAHELETHYRARGWPLTENDQAHALFITARADHVEVLYRSSGRGSLCGD